MFKTDNSQQAIRYYQCQSQELIITVVASKQASKQKVETRNRNSDEIHPYARV